jgi:hypothetical protein
MTCEMSKVIKRDKKYREHNSSLIFNVYVILEENPRIILLEF